MSPFMEGYWEYVRSLLITNERQEIRFGLAIISACLASKLDCDQWAMMESECEENRFYYLQSVLMTEDFKRVQQVLKMAKSDIHLRHNEKSLLFIALILWENPNVTQWLIDQGLALRRVDIPKDTCADALDFLDRAGFQAEGRDTPSLQRLCARRIREEQVDCSALPGPLVGAIEKYSL